MNQNFEVNNKIKATQVRVVNKDNEQLGVMATAEALAKAQDQGLDLVLVNPKIDPPLCKIVDFGKFKYDLARAEKDRKRKNRENQIETKEIQLRPVTDAHDIGIKAKRAKEFLADGDKVKVVLKFRGREVSHQEMGRKVIESFCNVIGEAFFKVDSPLTVNGRQMMMVLAPNKK